MATRKASKGSKATGPVFDDVAMFQRLLVGLADGSVKASDLTPEQAAGLAAMAKNAEEAQRAIKAAAKGRRAKVLGDGLAVLIGSGLWQSQVFSSGASGYRITGEATVNGVTYAVQVLLRDKASIPAD